MLLNDGHATDSQPRSGPARVMSHAGIRLGESAGGPGPGHAAGQPPPGRRIPGYRAVTVTVD